MTINVAVITVSDRSYRGEREDRSGKLLSEIVEQKLGNVLAYKVIPDEIEMIKREILRCVDELKADIVITTGGTGISERDVTPDATGELLEKEMPGISEIVRIKGYEHTPMSLLSRAKAGVRGKSIIVNLPGSPKAVEESLDYIIPALKHGIEVLNGLSKE
ncbi:MAG: MogA/MoaB family molybdenum cofactor biosynthesis protein [Candidatus Cloacimonadota bacterium]|nr:MAG: MogA/MoaB family molybdenum cofactor biosynthesis protein [Candidatus Cloacimonadota bacterium]